MTTVDSIIGYENGDLTPDEIVELFSDLVRNGTAWRLQGHYGRTAGALIQGGWIDDAGNILRRPSEED